MDYKRFGFAVFLRILLIVIIGIGGFSLAIYSSIWMLSIWIGLIDILLFFELYRYIKKYYNDVLQFLNNLGSGEFPELGSFNEGILDDQNFKSAFIRLSRNMQQVKMQRERNYLLLRMVVDSVKTAFVCFDEEDKIFLINSEAKLLFGGSNTNQVDVLFRVLPKELQNSIKELKSREKIIRKVYLNDELLHLLIESNVFVLDEKKYWLLTFNDIKQEMIEQEIGSYQKLTRIINHEIMNSAIPISNLTNLVIQVLENKDVQSLSHITSEELSDIKLSLNTIESRTNGLVSFIKAVKNFNAIKKTKFEEINIEKIIEEVLQLFKKDFTKSNINVEFEKEVVLMITGDRNLLEQLFINIIKNAIQALGKTVTPTLKIAIKTNSEITIEDNGVGIPTEKINDIFVPFYTTKKDGSGIGLSVCRQIMLLHKGEINISSTPGVKTIVYLSF